MCTGTLTGGEVRGLTAPHGEQTVSTLATDHERGLSYTSKLVERLETAGVVETRRLGKTTLIRLSNAEALELLAASTRSIRTSTGRSGCQG